MPPSIIPMFAMPPTVPASRGATASFASGKLSIAAPAANAQAISAATRASRASPGTNTTTAHAQAAIAIPAIMGLRRLPARCDIQANASPPTAHVTSIAEARLAAARGVNPCWVTRKGTPHRPANARTIPDNDPGTTSIAHVTG